MGSFFVTTGGWFAWNGFLDGVFAPSPSGPYAIRDTFTQHFGRDATWWSTMFLVLGFLGLMDLVLLVVKRNLRLAGFLHWKPWKKLENRRPEELELEIWQELEQDPIVKKRLQRLANDEVEDEDEWDADVESMLAADAEKRPVLHRLGKFRRVLPTRLR